MKTTARDVINTDELEHWLEAKFTAQHPRLHTWTLGPVRKWCIKHAPAYDDGAGETRVFLNQELCRTLTPVLEFMEALLDRKPDLDYMSIGFDVAQARHALDVRKNNREPVPEAGAEILQAYSDGWTWRKLHSVESLGREGELMGHCIGNGNYWSYILRDNGEVLSLRDQRNVPHVTIFTDGEGTTIRDIKGQTNKDVTAKHVPRVVEFLSKRDWDTVNLHECELADALRGVIKMQVLHEDNRYTLCHETIRSCTNRFAVRDKVTNSHAGYLYVEGHSPDPHNVRAVAFEDAPDYNAALQEQLSIFVLSSIIKYRMKIEAGILIKDLDSNAAYAHLGHGWYRPGDATALLFAEAFSGCQDACILVSDKTVIGYYSPATRTLTLTGFTIVADPDAWWHRHGAATVLPDEFKLALKHAPGRIESVVQRESKTNNTLPRFYRAVLHEVSLLNKASVVNGETKAPRQLLNALLLALQQPSLSKIRTDAHDLTRVHERTLKERGYKTGGRGIDLLATALLMCEAPVQPQAAAWMLNKPAALNLWCEVLSQSDFLQQALTNNGLHVETVSTVTQTLKNEFLRLIPSMMQAYETHEEPRIRTRVCNIIHGNGTHNDPKLTQSLWASPHSNNNECPKKPTL